MSKTEVISISGVNCYEDNGTAFLRLEDVAWGLGFTQVQNKNGKEYSSVRWETVNRYLSDIGFPNKLGKDDFIPENIFYRLAMKAKNERAERFQALVADEIIPSIRKHGAYMTDKVLEQAIADPDFMIGLLQDLKKERAARIEAEEKRDLLIHQSKLYTTSEIAKELGIKSAIALNKILERDRVQYKCNNTWLLYSKYANRGLVSIKQEALDNGKVIYDRRWTGTGRDLILSMYSSKK